jgi:protein-tyrosine kinase
MSKIQKALEQLKDVQDATDRGIDKDFGGAVDGEDMYRRVNGDRRQDAKRRRYMIPDKDLAEVQPSYRVEADKQILTESGLLPAETDSDLLAQQFRRIKRPILHIAFGGLANDEANSNVIMVASALPKSGKTFCSFSLASSIARERDIGAVLVDADVLKPNISRAFQIEDRVGLIDYLLRPDIQLDDILVATNIDDVIVVPAGQRHEEATELLSSRRMEQFVSELSQRYRRRAIVVDTPPLLLTNEAHVLAEHMGQIVLVIEAGATAHESILSALESLNRDKPINAIINKARGVESSLYGKYGGAYYGYYPSSGSP